MLCSNCAVPSRVSCKSAPTRENNSPYNRCVFEIGRFCSCRQGSGDESLRYGWKIYFLAACKQFQRASCGNSQLIMEKCFGAEIMLPLMKPAALSKYGCLVATDGRGRSAKYMTEVCKWARCAEKQALFYFFGVRPFCLSEPDSRHLSTNDARGRSDSGRCNFWHLSLPPIRPRIIFTLLLKLGGGDREQQ